LISKNDEHHGSRSSEEHESYKCSMCGGPLTTVPWNSVTDIAYCDNANCSSYHVPVRKHELTYAERNKKTVSLKDRIERMKESFLFGYGTNDSDG